MKTNQDRLAEIKEKLRLQKVQRESSRASQGTLVASSNEGIVEKLLAKLKREITDIENRSDLTTEQKIKQITHITCAGCAGIAIQPIPFADIFILTPVQAYMGSRIAAIRGVPVSESEVSDVIKEIAGVIGMGVLAQQLAIGIWKTLTFGFGGLATIPIVYGLSYAIMRVIDAYYVAKAQNRRLSDDEIKNLWRNAKSEGERQGKAHEQNTKK